MTLQMLLLLLAAGAISEHGAWSKDLPSHQHHLLQLLNRGKRSCNSDMCKYEPNMFLDTNSCTCKVCCFTPEEKLGGNHVTECVKKNQNCAKYARWSRCPRHDPIEEPPEDTPPSSVCTGHLLSSTATLEHLTPTPQQDPTKLTPTPEHLTPTPQQDPTNITPTPEHLTPTPQQDPTKLTPTPEHLTPTPQQDPTKLTPTPKHLRPTHQQDPTKSTPEGGSDPTNQTPSVNQTANSTSDALKGNSTTHWTSGQIAGTAFGGICVVVFICVVVWKFRCCKICPRKAKAKDHRLTISTVTVDDGDAEALLTSSEESDPDQITTANTPEEPTSTSDLIVEVANESLQQMSDAASETHSVAEVYDISRSSSNTSSMNAHFRGRNHSDCDLQDREDSGFISGPSGHPTPEKSPKVFYNSLKNICSQLTTKIITKLHNDCKQKCDTIEKWKTALQKAGADANQMDSLDKLTVKDLLDNPRHIDEVFVGACEGSIRPVLKFIQDCRLCHPQDPVEQSKFLIAVGQVLEIFADSLTDNSSRNLDSVKTGEFLSDTERKDINSFIKQLETHPDFPSNDLQEDLKMMQVVLKTMPNVTSVMSIQQEYTKLQRDTSKLQQDTSILQQDAVEEKKFRRRQQKLNSAQSKWNAEQVDINTNNTMEMDSLGERLAELEMQMVGDEIEPDEPESQEEPEITVYSLTPLGFVFIRCKFKKYKEVPTSFKLLCADKNCSEKFCLGHDGLKQELSHIPRACLFPDLRANHTYNLEAIFGSIRKEERFKTSEDVCHATFTDILDNGTLSAKLTTLCDSVGAGDRLTKTVACLLDCRTEHRNHKFHRGNCSVIEKVLEERPDMPVFVLIACARYLKMQEVINLVAEWHGDCPACSRLYRL